MEISLTQPINGVTLRVHDIQGHITGSWYYRIYFISASGDFKVTFDKGGVTLNSDLPVHTQDYNGRRLPKLDVQNLHVNINSDKIHIDLSGSFISSIMDPFVSLFKSLIIGKIQDAINDNVPGALSGAIDDEIHQLNGFATIYDGVTIDFQLPEDPIVTSTQLGFFLNATIFNTSLGYKIPPTPISDVDVGFTTQNTILVDCSAYTADSLM